MDDFKRAMEKFQEQFQAVLSMIETQAEQIHENMLVLKDDLERLRSIDVEDDMEADSAHFEDASESEGINSEADSFPSLCDDVNNPVSLVNENEMHLEVENSAYKVFDESPEIISDEIRTEIEAQFSDIYICETILRKRLAQKIAIHEVSDVIVEMDDSKNLFSRHFKDEVGSLSLDVLVENSSGEVIAFQFRSDIVYFDDFWGQKSLKDGVLGREMVIECFGWKPGWVLVIRTMDRELFVNNTRKIWTKKRWLLSFVFEWKPGLRCSSMGKLRKELKNGWKDGEVGVIKNDMIQVVFSGFELHELQELKSVMSDSGWPKAFKEPCTLKHIKEAIFLCTCNQMETCVVALSQHRGVKEVTRGILKIGWISVTANSGHFFLLCNNEATHHVFEVLARLDSLVRAQVKQVTKAIQRVPGFRRTISGLFKHTIMSLGVQAFQKELLEARGTALGVKEVLEAIKRLHKLCTDFGGSIDEIHFLFSSFFAFLRAKMILHSTTIGKIHSTFHVSLLKQAHGTRIPTGPMPKSPRFFLQPRAVLHTQVIKKGNKAVAKILVHWEGLSISEASWEVLGRYAMLNVNTVMESNDMADANVIDHCEIEIVESQFVGFLMTSKLMFCGRSDGAYLQMRYSAFSTERAEPECEIDAKCTERAEPECEIDAFNLHSSGLPNKRGTRIQKFKLHSSRLPNKKGTRIQKFKLHSSRLPNKKGIRIQKHLKDWFWLFFELHKGNCEVASLDDVEKRVPAFDFED